MSGTITPDHYQVAKDTYEVVSEFVPTKSITFCSDASGGVLQLPVPAERATARVLTEQELRQLVELGICVQRHFARCS